MMNRLYSLSNLPCLNIPLVVTVIESSSRRPSSTLAHVNKWLESQSRILHVTTYFLKEENLPLFSDYQESSKWITSLSLEKILISLLSSDLIVLASPVYWYSVSHLMKNFFDHWTYFLRHKKSPGTQFLKNKMIFPIFVGHENLGKSVNRVLFGPVRMSAQFAGARALPGFFGIGGREGIADNESLERIAKIDTAFFWDNHSKSQLEILKILKPQNLIFPGTFAYRSGDIRASYPHNNEIVILNSSEERAIDRIFMNWSYLYFNGFNWVAVDNKDVNPIHSEPTISTSFDEWYGY